MSDVSDEPDDVGHPTLAHKLDRLFRTVRPAPTKEYSSAEVATAVAEAGGPTISSTYVWQLRKGMRDNPTKHHLEALASFFGVSPAYFLDDDAAARMDAELELLSAIRDTSIRQIALRSAGLSAGSLQTIADVIERVRVLEGLDSTPPSERGDGGDRGPTTET